MIESGFGLTENDLDVIAEQIARIWLATRGFSADYIPIKDDWSDYDDEHYLDEDIYDF